MRSVPTWQGWAAGQRVGVGWHGGNCGYCDTCRRGDPFACEIESLVTGITSDGRYADYMVARAEAGAGSGGFAERRCRTFDVRWHHNLQRPTQQRRAARRDGRGTGPWRARQLGAYHYLDNAAEDPAAALQKLGGAKAILATMTSADAMSFGAWPITQAR